MAIKPNSSSKTQYVVQHHAVEREDTLLLGSLLQIFESTDKAAEFEEAAEGSGTKLLELMIEGLGGDCHCQRSLALDRGTQRRSQGRHSGRADP